MFYQSQGLATTFLRLCYSHCFTHVRYLTCCSEEERHHTPWFWKAWYETKENDKVGYNKGQLHDVHTHSYKCTWMPRVGSTRNSFNSGNNSVVQVCFPWTSALLAMLSGFSSSFAFKRRVSTSVSICCNSKLKEKEHQTQIIPGSSFGTGLLHLKSSLCCNNCCAALTC